MHKSDKKFRASLEGKSSSEKMIEIQMNINNNLVDINSSLKSIATILAVAFVLGIISAIIAGIELLTIMPPNV